MTTDDTHDHASDETSDGTSLDVRAAPSTKGRVLRAGVRWYDPLAWLLTLGRERALRERLVALARLAPGEAVLDVGCGTGSLAVAAARSVAPAGETVGVDASPEMIAHARRKAARAGVDVAFEVGVAEALPFADARFDVVLGTLMLHHLPRPTRERCAREMRRVLRPGGRLLVADFAPAPGSHGMIGRLHRHGHVAPERAIELLRAAGLRVVERGAVGAAGLWFALAEPADGEAAEDAPATRDCGPLPGPSWPVRVAGGAALAVAVAGHVLLLRGAWAVLAPGAVAVMAVVLVARHRHAVGGRHRAH